MDGDIFFLEPDTTSERQSPANSNSTRPKFHTTSSSQSGDSRESRNPFSNLANEDGAASHNLLDYNATSEDYTVEEEVRNKLRRLARLKDGRNAAEEDVEEDSEESYLPDGHYTIFGGGAGATTGTPPRLHIFRRTGLGPGSPNEVQSRQKRRAGESPIVSMENGARTLSGNQLGDSISSDVSASSDDQEELRPPSPGTERHDSLHVCDTSGEYTPLLLQFH